MAAAVHWNLIGLILVCDKAASLALEQKSWSETLAPAGEKSRGHKEHPREDPGQHGDGLAHYPYIHADEMATMASRYRALLGG